MPERKASRERAARIVEGAAAPPRPAIPRAADYELALKSASLAESMPREQIVHRIVCEWLKQQGYLR